MTAKSFRIRYVNTYRIVYYSLQREKGFGFIYIRLIGL